MTPRSSAPAVSAVPLHIGEPIPLGDPSAPESRGWITRASRDDLRPVAGAGGPPAWVPVNVPMLITKIDGGARRYHGQTVQGSLTGICCRLAFQLRVGVSVEFLALSGVRRAAAVGTVRRCVPEGGRFHCEIVLTARSPAWAEMIIGEQSAGERKRRGEMARAREVYDHLLPAALPELAELDLHAALSPAGTVGGDYFDVIRLPDNRLILSVADVAGKGFPAAITVATFRAFLRGTLDFGLTGIEAMRRINRLLVRTLPAGHFVTAVLVEIDLATGRLHSVNAGHPLGLMVRGGRSFAFRATGDVLGAGEEPGFGEAASQLEPGDLLCWYTDGVTEAANAAGEAYGRTRLADLLAKASGEDAQGVCTAVSQDLERFVAGPRTMNDDTTVLVAKWRGTGKDKSG